MLEKTIFGLIFSYAAGVVCAFFSDWALSALFFANDDLGNWNLLSIGVWSVALWWFQS